MQRRGFLSLLGAAVAVSPSLRRQTAHAQQAMPVIGVLSGGSSRGYGRQLAGFRKSLADAGYVEGRNVAIEHRWADGQYDRLPAMAAELVRRQVAVIVAAPTLSALAAAGATKTIPIVFEMSSD